MKVLGIARYRSFEDQWDRLADLALECVNILLKRAVKQNRDVIVDEHNTHPANRRKHFVEYQRASYYCQAMVSVPTELVRLERVTTKPKDSRPITEAKLNKMKAEFFVPQGGIDTEKY
jgi:hypothetical protein